MMARSVRTPRRASGTTLGLVVHPRKAVGRSVETIVRWAEAHRATVVAREEDADRVGPRVAAVDAEQFLRRVDAVVSLGGDGTMLGAMRLVAARPVPVLGVNHGNLGFLVEVEPKDLDDTLGRLAEGRYTVEPHSCLVMTRSDADAPTLAFNDVVLTGPSHGHTVSLDLLVNDSRYGYYRCDAVVICTSTGSTAYNYAAGGPVISPSTQAVTVTPVAPMSGISRSVVLGPGDVLSLRDSDGRSSVGVLVDGISDARLRSGVTVTLRMRSEAAFVVRLEAERHARRARVKLSLLDLPLRPDQLLELVPAELREEAERVRHRGADDDNDSTAT